MVKVKITCANSNISTFPYHKHEIHIPKVQGFLEKLHIYQCYYHFLKDDFHILQNDFRMMQLHLIHLTNMISIFGKVGDIFQNINFTYQVLENIWMN